MNIEWERLAEPQTDGHDVAVMKANLKEKWNYEKVVRGSEFLGNVHLSPYTQNYNPGFFSSHPENIGKVERGMTIWPELVHTYHELIEFIIFCESRQDNLFNQMYGCSCGHMWLEDNKVFNGRIGIFVAMLGTLGTLEALAHEAGHLRLRMLGIQIEDHDNTLILNGPDELFNSPIRKDKPRPMSAVLQAQYSYVMVSNMDLKYYDAADTDSKRECAVAYLKMNIPRIAKGHEEVKNNIKVTPEGQRFIDGFWRYSDAVIERGTKLIG